MHLEIGLKYYLDIEFLLSDSLNIDKNMEFIFNNFNQKTV